MICAIALVRHRFPGRSILNAVIDLPFAVSPVIIGLALILVYGQAGWFGGWLADHGIQVIFSIPGMILATTFVSLPFVVRAVQPVLLELDRDMEEAAASLGAGNLTIFRRVILPNLLPAILSGVGLGFARSVGEFGSLVLITGNLPFKTEVGSVYIFNQLENDNLPGAAAVSVVLLLAALLVLGLLTLLSRWRSRHVL